MEFGNIVKSLRLANIRFHGEKCLQEIETNQMKYFTHKSIRLLWKKWGKNKVCWKHKLKNKNAKMNVYKNKMNNLFKRSEIGKRNSNWSPGTFPENHRRGKKEQRFQRRAWSRCGEMMFQLRGQTSPASFFLLSFNRRSQDNPPKWDYSQHRTRIQHLDREHASM